MIATGDFHQFPPVQDQWVFNKTNIRGRCDATATNIWKVYFKIYKLSQHVWYKTDHVYSWLQENIATGNGY